jgi:hypothetical protein
LPSSLTRVLSSALGCSPCLPVSVYGTITLLIECEAFPGSMESTTLLPLRASSSHLSVNKDPDLPKSSAYMLEPGRPTPGWSILLRPPASVTPVWWYRNINLFPINYASRPRLRDRLTLSRLTLLQETLGFRREGFSPSFSLLVST